MKKNRERFVAESPKSDEWEIKTEKLKQLRDKLFYLLTDKYGEAEGINRYDLFKGEVFDSLNAAGLDRDDVEKIIAVHILVGGSPVFDFCDKFDLPGDLSIEKKYKERLLKESNK